MAKQDHPRSLGRRPPERTDHLDKFPLTAIPEGEAPVVLGINWYTAFDRPFKDSTGRWWIASNSASLGTVRGGHCIAAKPYAEGAAVGPNVDKLSWWKFYDQGSEGACVGFGWARALSMMAPGKYDAPGIYHDAQLHDEYPDTPPAEGSSVRGGAAAVIADGAGRRRLGIYHTVPAPFSAYHWATTWDQVRSVLGVPDHGYVTLCNSWGTAYPRHVNVPDEVGARLLHEDGEAAVPL